MINIDQSATSGKNAGTHTCGPFPIICLHSSPVARNDGLWWVKEKQGTAKTVVGIAAATMLNYSY
jgi:hypothetical protein